MAKLAVALPTATTRKRREKKRKRPEATEATVPADLLFAQVAAAAGLLDPRAEKKWYRLSILGTINP
jgi:hypothetical protein